MSSAISSVSDLQQRLKGERTAIVTTIDERGTLSSRPVTLQRFEDNGDLWFLVDQDADWVSPADGAPVNASVVDEGSTWVSFAGRAALVDDPVTIAELCDAISDTFFEQGATPVALRVVTDRVEWWTAPGKVAQAMEMAKAKATGSEPDLGSSGTLEV